MRGRLGQGQSSSLAGALNRHLFLWVYNVVVGLSPDVHVQAELPGGMEATAVNPLLLQTHLGTGGGCHVDFVLIGPDVCHRHL